MRRHHPRVEEGVGIGRQPEPASYMPQWDACLLQIVVGALKIQSCPLSASALRTLWDFTLIWRIVLSRKMFHVHCTAAVNTFPVLFYSRPRPSTAGDSLEYPNPSFSCLIYSLIYLFIHSFIHSFICLFIYLSVLLFLFMPFSVARCSLFYDVSGYQLILLKKKKKKKKMIIAFKGAIRDFLQSPHSAANCLQHVRSSGPGVTVCKSRATHRALITCKCRVTCNLVLRDSSAVNFDRVEIAFIWALFYGLNH